VESVEERLIMKKRGVIDIEDDLAHEGERVVSVLITENADVACDQATERIQSQMTNRRFDPAPMQFLNNPRTRLGAKALPRHIPRANKRGGNREPDRGPQRGNREPPSEGRLSILRS